MQLRLNGLGYLETPGLNVMLGQDFYPEGHQGGLTIIQHGRRVAANGDVRLEPVSGQWSPVPKLCSREVATETDEILVQMEYPDESRNRTGFNPIDYPDLEFGYTVRVRPDTGGFRVRVDLDRELPTEWQDKVGFCLELMPAFLFGKTYQTETTMGVFMPQGDGPCGAPLATGKRLTIAAECPEQRLTIESVEGAELDLLDARTVHNNGWFTVRSTFHGTKIEWKVAPNVIEGWSQKPTIQVSQVGYHPAQPKLVVIELDPTESGDNPVELLKVTATGLQNHGELVPERWGRFLRYDYLKADFTHITEPGMYVVRYGDVQSSPFQINDEVFNRHVWQPTLDTFLPVQMCHMRVVENYRVWHGACHLDDARMAPTGLNHVDGYVQGNDTLCEHRSGVVVPGLNVGGWHDAGDYDLRVESQAHTVHGLALAFEEFRLDYDDTTVDQANRLVELRKPDGIPDILQQVEHGVLAIIAGYRATGRHFRGIIESTRKQYVHLGDAATQTDNVFSDDDRWVFTQPNRGRELDSVVALAAASRVLGQLNPSLARQSLELATELFAATEGDAPMARALPALELLLATGEARFRDEAVAAVEGLEGVTDRNAGAVARAVLALDDLAMVAQVRPKMVGYAELVAGQAAKTPYGVPYEPRIWGAGWGIQRFGVQQYWLHKAFPDLFSADLVLNALNFVLGCHPGPNTASFVSGVGAKSMIPGYGVNRADNSYIPGGVGSGTSLIRPDFPELLEWPYLWQQTEYCVGYPTTDFIFLAAAAGSLMNGR